MPQRYLLINEILQELDRHRAQFKARLPKRPDIFAVLGNNVAEKILLNDYKEEENWKKYPEVFMV